MTNQQIEQQFELKVREERRISKEIIQLIALVDERKIFAERGYPSLFEWLTKKYGYSEGAANRRISAARLMRAVPEVAEKVESGKLNLTTLSRAHSILRAQEKATGKKLDAKLKRNALQKVENTTTAQAEKSLFALFPEASEGMKREAMRTMDSEHSRLHANISSEVRARFERVREILSNKLPNASFVDAADFLFKKLIEEQDRNTAAASKQSVNDQNQSLTTRTKRIVLKDSHCQFRDPVTGRKCGSRYHLHVDHVLPKALGGTNHSSNLRPLCGTHNRFEAERILGTERANRWRKQLAEDSEGPS